MKIGIPFIAALVFSTARLASVASADTSWAAVGPSGESFQDRLLNDQFIKAYAIEAVLQERCDRYVGVWPIGRCHRMAHDVYQIVDETSLSFFVSASGAAGASGESGSARIESSVAFRSELIKLSQDSRVYYFLKDLNSELAASAGAPSAWRVAVRNAADEREALKWMAVLFQDTTESQTQVAYLERITNPTKLQQGILIELKKAVATFLSAGRYFESGAAGGDLKGLLAFYPPDAQATIAEMNGSFYHYYVPGFIASELVRRGYSEDEAVFGAYAFNYLYKIYKAARSAVVAVAEPSAIADRDEAVDIEMALLGASRGVGRAGESLDAAQTLALIQSAPKKELRILGSAASKSL